MTYGVTLLRFASGQGQFFYGCQHLIPAFVTCQGLTPAAQVTEKLSQGLRESRT